VLIASWAVLGWLVGLGLEVIGRQLTGQGSSICPTCQHDRSKRSLSAFVRSLGPVGQHCPRCGKQTRTWLSLLAPGTALTFVFLSTHQPLGLVLLVMSLYGAILLLVASLDLHRRLVYPQVTYPSTLLAIGLTPIALQQPIWSGLAGTLAGAGLFLFVFLLAGRIYGGQHALGFGDVMIAGLVGAMAGFPAVSSALMFGTLFGGVGAVAIGFVTRSRRTHFAYGPALCLGGLVSLLVGQIP
jgi:leader peptidase (prepilin peptidase)/N-methyltransferase